MMVDRSTWCSAAASAIVTSCRTSCNQISYFWETDRNRFARLPARSAPRPYSDMIRSSTIGRRTRSMLSDPGRDLYHEVRRKPSEVLDGRCSGGVDGGQDDDQALRRVGD